MGHSCASFAVGVAAAAQHRERAAAGIMPLVGLASVHQMSAWGLLPQSAACKMALLVQSCMPSAQNLVLLVNLKSETKAMAPMMAQLLIRQYVLAVIPKQPCGYLCS